MMKNKNRMASAEPGSQFPAKVREKAIADEEWYELSRIIGEKDCASL